MQKVILSITLIMTGCAAFSSPRTTLVTLQDAAIAAHSSIRPVIDAYCAQAKADCDEANKLEAAYLVSTSDCPAFDACNKARMIIITTLEGIQFAIADANLALSLGQDERFDVAIARALSLMADVQRQMQILGIIPGAENVSPPK